MMTIKQRLQLHFLMVYFQFMHSCNSSAVNKLSLISEILKIFPLQEVQILMRVGGAEGVA